MEDRVIEMYNKHHDKYIKDKVIKFKFNNNKSRAGVCYFSPSLEIQLSRHYINAETTTLDDINNTILHELAHGIAGHDAGHGIKWKRIAKSIGCNGNTCTSLFIKKKDFKHVITCGLGCSIHRHRKTSKLRICKKHKTMMT